MRSLRLAFALICVYLAGCGGEETAPSTPEMSGHRITMSVALKPDANDLLPVLTASASVQHFSPDFFRGKSWIGTVFEGGADVGVDRPIHTQWGVVPDSLAFDFTPDRRFEAGPYDVFLMVLGDAEIPDELKGKEFTELGPQAFANAITSFSLDRSVIRDGDPDFSPGAIRYNVDDEDVTVEVENRWASEEDPPEVWTSSFTETFLLFPSDMLP